MLKLKELKYIVTGTGRCGTVYMAKLLSSIGIPCTHEGIFQQDGLVAAQKRMQEPLEVSKIAKMTREWLTDEEVVAESSYMAAPFLDQLDATIIHVVRHPMKVINSFVAGLEYFNDWCLEKPDFAEYHRFIYNEIHELYQDMSSLERCIIYWTKWNQLITQKSKNKRYFLYRIEQSPIKLFDFLGIKPKDYYKNTKVNEKLGLKNKYTNFNQLPEGNIKQELLKLYHYYYSVSL